jgi:hypothetical protein
MPQPPPQLLLLLSGQQLLNKPFYLHVQRPFIPPMYPCLLLHLQCHFLHYFTYLNELQIHVWLALFLLVPSLTTPMAFSIHFHLLPALLVSLSFTLQLISSLASPTTHMIVNLMLHMCKHHSKSINTLSSFTFCL